MSDREQIERIVEQEVAKQLESSNDVSCSRRRLLGLLGGGAIGAGILGTSTTPAASDHNPSSIDVDTVTAHEVHALDELTLGGVSVSTDGSSDGSGSPIFSSSVDAAQIYVAETGDDIQPAIDYCAEHDIRGVIQLLPREYIPPDQIELKGAVVLRGVDAVNTRGPSAATTIRADTVPDGEAVIRFRTNDEEYQAKAAQLHNIRVQGQRDEGKSVHGIEVGFVGNPIIDKCIVYECERHGVVFNDTQSAQIRRTRISRCGNAENDWHGLDIGGVVRDEDSSNRATVVGSVFVGNGPHSDAAPIKLRNGSTLHIKPADMRTGVRVHGGNGIEKTDEPGIDIAGGELVADNTLVTANIESLNAGIRLRENGSLMLRDSTVERCDPNIDVRNGKLSLHNTGINQGEDWGNGGHGIVIPENEKGKLSRLDSVDLMKNDGHGIILGEDATINPIWFDIRTESNGGYGIDGRNSQGATVVGMWRKDDAGNANELGMYAGTDMRVDYLSGGKRPDDGDENVSPSVDSLSASEVETDSSDAEFDIDWAVSDDDGNLAAVELELIDETEGVSEDVVRNDVSGKSASGSTRLVAVGDDGSDHSYTVSCVVEDGDGAIDSATVSMTESEGDDDGGSNGAVMLENAEAYSTNADIQSRYTGEFAWTADKGGDGYWGINTDPDDPHGAVLSGNVSMKGYQAAHGGYHTIVSMDEETRQGDTYRAQIYHPHNHTYTGLLFGVQSTEYPYPCYRLKIDNGGGSGEVNFEKITPDGPIETHEQPAENILLDAEDLDLDQDQEWVVEWTWNDDGTVDITLTRADDGVVKFDGTADPDTDYTSGGFGLMVSKSNPNADDMTSIVDNFEVISRKD